MDKDFTIYATHGDDFERIIQANFLNEDELTFIHDFLTQFYKLCDDSIELLNSMNDAERYKFELDGLAQNIQWTDNPIIIFDNKKHKDLMCYLELGGIGMLLQHDELPDAFDRLDTINLARAHT